MPRSVAIRACLPSAATSRRELGKSLNDLRDKRLLTFEQDKLSRVELLAKKQDIEFGRDKNQWQILKPKPLRADGLQVDELFRKLKDAKMDLTLSDEDAKKAASSFASGSPVATVKLTDSSGTEQIEIRKNKDDYYAKSSVVPGVYKVTAELGAGVDKGLDDFRNKKLFDFGFMDPNKVEMHLNGKFYGLQRSATKTGGRTARRWTAPACSRCSTSCATYPLPSSSTLAPSEIPWAILRSVPTTTSSWRRC